VGARWRHRVREHRQYIGSARVPWRDLRVRNRRDDAHFWHLLFVYCFAGCLHRGVLRGFACVSCTLATRSVLLSRTRALRQAVNGRSAAAIALMCRIKLLLSNAPSRVSAASAHRQASWRYARAGECAHQQNLSA